MTTLDAVDTALEGEPVGLESAGVAELYTFDEDPIADPIDQYPDTVPGMQDYATDIMSDPTIEDEVVNELAEGLAGGVHNSGSDDPYDEHTTIKTPDGVIHYDEESGTWQSYEDE